MPLPNNVPPGVEAFLWKGQTRYRCPTLWESGAKCQYDSADLALLAEHMKLPHTRNIPTGPAPAAPAQTPKSVEETEARSPEFKEAKFAPSEE